MPDTPVQHTACDEQVALELPELCPGRTPDAAALR